MAIQISWRWWVWPYVNTCKLFAQLTGLQPDVERIVRTALRGVVIKVDRFR